MRHPIDEVMLGLDSSLPKFSKVSALVKRLDIVCVHCHGLLRPFALLILYALCV